MKKHALGLKGENIAYNYLMGCGYIIHQTNYRFGRYEVDIIAQEASELVFIEVKTRTSSEFGSPETFVSEAQQLRLIACADAYVKTSSLLLAIRFDVIAITWNNNRPTLKHLKDAFWPLA